jgi:hypothetical protein
VVWLRSLLASLPYSLFGGAVALRQNPSRFITRLDRRAYTHKTVRHSAGEFVRDMAHTNGIESFWSLLKRGYIGVYHYMSEHHLHRYVNEFSFRHNTSKVGTINFINMTMDRMVGRRLTYKDLTNG